jgi:DNA-binding response OmpR family regulator
VNAFDTALKPVAETGSFRPRGILSFGNVTVNFDIYQVSVGQARPVLARQQFDLLTNLALHRDTVIGFSELTQAIWGECSAAADRRLITLVHRLRTHMAGMYPYEIVSVRGVGYGLVDTGWAQSIVRNPQRADSSLERDERG